MSFTYNLASADPAIVTISRVRLEIGDEVADAGVRPDDRNLSDEEIAIWLADEDNAPLRAAAAACEALARIWARVANMQIGQRREDLGAVAAAWAARGKELRSQVGGGGGSSSSFGFSSGWSRDDGYAELDS